MKRLLDIILSTIFLVLLAPVLLVIAALVRLTSSGPVFFRQERLGMHATKFRMWKFRSMVVGAPDLRNDDGTTVNFDGDSRVTLAGRLLRRTSLDELPQLWNVLRGEMSLVGPRPELVDGLNGYTPEHSRRLDVRPGITGWAAVHGRNDLRLLERRDLDVWYVEHATVWLDMQILVRTVSAVITGRGIVSGTGELLR